MNEDLHDIDKLFKDGLDGHLEEPPPSVWEEVSHDLDKKQAVHFRDKYYRLKRAAILFLLIGFVGGIGFVYFTTGKKDSGKPFTARTSSTTTTHSQEKNSTTTNLHFDSAVVSKDEPVVTNANHQNQSATDVDHQPENLSKEPSDKIKGNEKQNSGTVKKDNSKPVADQYIIIDNKATDKKKINKENRINKQLSATPKDKGSVATTGARKGLQQPITIYTNGLVSSGDRSPLNNHPTDNRAFQKPTGIKTNIARQTSQLLQEGLPERKIEALSHTTFPPINLKQSFAERTNVATASNSNKPGKPRSNASHHFYLTAFFAPNISFDHLEDDDHLAGPGRDRNEIRRDEHSSSSVSGGLFISYALTGKVALQTGVTITSSSTGIAPKKLYARPDNNGHTSFELHCSSGYSYITPKNNAQPAVGDSVSILGSTSKLSYVSVPLSASLTIQKGKFSLHPTIGIGANFLTGGKTETTLPNTESATATITGLRSVYMDGRIGVGAEYELNKRIAISLKPTARLALTPINQQTPVKSYQNYLSIDAGIKIKL